MVEATIWTICSLPIPTLCFFVWENYCPVCLFSISTTIQYVIYTYMKHLGVRVKEPRSLESKRVRINFLPKIKVWVMLVLAPLALPFPLALLSLTSTCCLLCFFVTYRRASGQKRKVKRRWRNPDFLVSLDLSADPAALNQHRVTDSL